jgi:NADH:ubiquinone reductase (H+-translocating)
MSQQHQILILGGGYAGMMTALRLAGRNKTAQITLVNGIDTFTERIRMHELATNHPPKQRSIVEMLRGKNIQFIQGWVKAIHPEAHEVDLQTTEGMQTLRYQKLVYALGSAVDRDIVPGVREHAYVLNPGGDKSAPEMQIALANLAKIGGRVAVIGGGLTAIEGVTEIAETYPSLRVSIFMRGKVGENLSVKAQHYLRQTFGEMNISVYENSGVKEIKAGAVVVQDGTALPFDLILWAGGFRALPLAKAAGLAVNERGQMLVDPFLRSISHPDIYGAGDSAYPVERPGADIRMGCATALPMGAHVGENLNALLNNQPQQAYSFRYYIQCISLGRKDGLIQFVTPDDEPIDRILTGWAGAQFKEMICKFTVMALQVERTIPGAYPDLVYPDMDKVAQELSSTTRQSA